MNLDELNVGQTAVIQSLDKLSRASRKKFMSLGLLPNTEVTLVRKAPLGDPLQIQVRGSSFALVSMQASQIEVCA